jgi:hypothetical protein
MGGQDSRRSTSAIITRLDTSLTRPTVDVAEQYVRDGIGDKLLRT